MKNVIDMVTVSEAASYKGRTMNWTEAMEDSVASGKFIHFSDTKIDVFLAKETCFMKYDGSVSGSGFAYIITVSDRKCMESPDDDEFRFELDESDELAFVGEYEFAKTSELKYSNISHQDEPVYATVLVAVEK